MVREYAITVTNVVEAPTQPDAPGVAFAGVGELAVSWTAPIFTGPPISSYSLRYGTDGTRWTTVNVGLKTAQTLTGLTNDQEYHVQVRAMNADGDGPWSGTTKGTPELPSRIDTTMTVGHSGQLYGFSGTTGSISDATFDFLDTEYTITGLYEVGGQRLRFFTNPVISASNLGTLTLVVRNHAYSDLDRIASSTPHYNEAYPSRGLNLTDGEKVRVRVIQNNPPVFSGDPTKNVPENIDPATPALTVLATDTDTHDTVTYSLKDDIDDEAFNIDKSTGALTFKVAPDYENPIDRAESEDDDSDACGGKSGECNNFYHVTVIATSGTGHGTRTAERKYFIQVYDVGELLPRQVGAPAVSLGNSGVLKVSWTAPDNSGRPDISSYTLRYSTDNKTWTEVTPTTLTTSHDLTGLSNGTPYYVAVRATNDDGEGNGPMRPAPRRWSWAPCRSAQAAALSVTAALAPPTAP